LKADNTRKAAAAEVDGIMVSNHQNRPLEGVVYAVRAMPKITDAVGDRLCILANGRVYSGLDVVRMLALGANAVLIGKPRAYTLAASAQAVAEHVLERMHIEKSATPDRPGRRRSGAARPAQLVPDCRPPEREQAPRQ